MNHYYEKYLLRLVKIYFFGEVDNKTAPKNTFTGAGHSPTRPYKYIFRGGWRVARPCK